MGTWKRKRSARTKRVKATSFGSSAKESVGPKSKVCFEGLTIFEYTFHESKIQKSGLHNRNIWSSSILRIYFLEIEGGQVEAWLRCGGV